MEQPALGSPLSEPSRRALTRGLCLLIFALLLVALAYTAWAVVQYGGQISV